MAIPRCKQVDVTVTRWYHCISRCVRGARLLADSSVANRKRWLETRLRELSEIFSISVAGFSMMDSHLHVVLRIDADSSQAWSDREVITRWFRLFPPRGTDRKPLSPSQALELAEKRLSATEWIAEVRSRLSSISWFMKCLKEPLARTANKEDNCAGPFFAGRFKSIAILDEEALLSTCVYVDLNPIAAGIAATPESSEYTSVKARVDHASSSERTKDLRAAKENRGESSNAASSLEDTSWLIPVENHRQTGSTREGMIVGFTLGNYLRLVDQSGRRLRDGKASISKDLACILDRLGNSLKFISSQLSVTQGVRRIGRVFASRDESMVRAAQIFGVKRLVNRATSGLVAD